VRYPAFVHHPAPDRTVTYSHSELNTESRLRELIVYIAQRSAFDPSFGVTKLNKLLWWSDLRAFGMTGQSITGVTYKRLPQGPVPDGIDDLQARMESAGDIAIAAQERFGHIQRRVVPRRRADLSAFSGEEIAIVDLIMDEHRTHNAKGVSSRSHGRMWEALPHLARMPYESVFISEAKPSRYDVARTKELNRQFGWE
jgi:hypothetical protein